MKILTIFLYLTAIILGAFGYWGLFTNAGRQKYDEMAGFIPGFALLGSAVLFLIAVILTLIIVIKHRRQKL